MEPKTTSHSPGKQRASPRGERAKTQPIPCPSPSPSPSPSRSSSSSSSSSSFVAASSPSLPSAQHMTLSGPQPAYQEIAAVHRGRLFLVSRIIPFSLVSSVFSTPRALRNPPSPSLSPRSVSPAAAPPLISLDDHTDRNILAPSSSSLSTTPSAHPSSPADSLPSLSPLIRPGGDPSSIVSLLSISSHSSRAAADDLENANTIPTTTQVFIAKMLTHESASSYKAIDTLKRDFEANSLMASLAPEFFARPTLQVISLSPESYLRDLLRSHRFGTLNIGPPKTPPSLAILVEDMGATSVALFCKSLPDSLRGPAAFSRSVLNQLTNIRLPVDHFLIDPLRLDFFFPLAIKMTKSLLHLHDAGFLHNDIKSANFLIHPVSHKLWLIDFHACSAWKRPSSVSPSLFANDPSFRDHLTGTPLYMSPERIGRTSTPVDIRSDLYSLGSMFFELLVGCVPFHFHLLSNETLAFPQTRSSFKQDVIDVTHFHLSQPTPSVFSIRPDVPLFLSRMIAKMLEKNPEQRYNSCFGVLRDLELCFSHFSSGTSASLDFSPVSSKDPAPFLRSLSPHEQPLIGRTKEFRQVRAFFDKPSLPSVVRLVSLQGIKGSGKSSFLSIIAHRFPSLSHQCSKPLIVQVDMQRAPLIRKKCKDNVEQCAILNNLSDLLHSLLVLMQSQNLLQFSIPTLFRNIFGGWFPFLLMASPRLSALLVDRERENQTTSDDSRQPLDLSLIEDEKNLLRLGNALAKLLIHISTNIDREIALLIDNLEASDSLFFDILHHALQYMHTQSTNRSRSIPISSDSSSSPPPSSSNDPLSSSSSSPLSGQRPLFDSRSSSSSSSSSGSSSRPFSAPLSPEENPFSITFVVCTNTSTGVLDPPEQRWESILDKLHQESGLSLLDLRFEDLSKEHVAEYISMRLGHKDFPELIDLAYNKTRGHPTYLAQFIEALVERGVLFFDFASESWKLTKEVEDFPFYPNVNLMLISRRALLSKETVSHLEIASCVGVQFDLAILSRLLAPLSMQEICVSLRPGIEQELLTTTEIPESEPVLSFLSPPVSSTASCSPSAECPNVTYRFVDALLQAEFYRLFIGRHQTKIQSFLWENPHTLFCNPGPSKQAHEFFHMIPINIAVIHSNIAFLMLFSVRDCLSRGGSCSPVSTDFLIELASQLNKSSALLRLRRPMISHNQLGRPDEEVQTALAVFRSLCSPFDLLLISGSSKGEKPDLFSPDSQKLLLSQLNSIVARRLSAKKRHTEAINLLQSSLALTLSCNQCLDTSLHAKEILNLTDLLSSSFHSSKQHENASLVIEWAQARLKTDIESVDTNQTVFLLRLHTQHLNEIANYEKSVAVAFPFLSLLGFADVCTTDMHHPKLPALFEQLFRATCKFLGFDSPSSSLTNDDSDDPSARLNEKLAKLNFESFESLVELLVNVITASYLVGYFPLFYHLSITALTLLPQPLQPSSPYELTTVYAAIMALSKLRSPSDPVVQSLISVTSSEASSKIKLNHFFVSICNILVEESSTSPLHNQPSVYFLSNRPLSHSSFTFLNEQITIEIFKLSCKNTDEIIEFHCHNNSLFQSYDSVMRSQKSQRSSPKREKRQSVPPGLSVSVSEEVFSSQARQKQIQFVNSRDGAFQMAFYFAKALKQKGWIRSPEYSFTLDIILQPNKVLVENEKPTIWWLMQSIMLAKLNFLLNHLETAFEIVFSLAPFLPLIDRGFLSIEFHFWSVLIFLSVIDQLRLRTQESYHILSIASRLLPQDPSASERPALDLSAEVPMLIHHLQISIDHSYKEFSYMMPHGYLCGQLAPLLQAEIIHRMGVPLAQSLLRDDFPPELRTCPSSLVGHLLLRLYEEAIDPRLKHQSTAISALSAELASRMLEEKSSLPTASMGYSSRAIQLYNECGAETKVAIMVEQASARGTSFFDLQCISRLQPSTSSGSAQLKAANAVGAANTSQSETGSQNSSNLNVHGPSHDGSLLFDHSMQMHDVALNLESFLKTTEILSGCVSLGKVMENLIKVVARYAGATRACICVSSNSRHFVVSSVGIPADVSNRKPSILSMINNTESDEPEPEPLETPSPKRLQRTRSRSDVKLSSLSASSPPDTTSVLAAVVDPRTGRRRSRSGSGAEPSALFPARKVSVDSSSEGEESLLAKEKSPRGRLSTSGSEQSPRDNSSNNNNNNSPRRMMKNRSRKSSFTNGPAYKAMKDVDTTNCLVLEDIADEVPLSVMLRVLNQGTLFSLDKVLSSLLEGEASAELDDPYLKSRKPQSLICLPIIDEHTKLNGAFYLENSITRGIFSQTKINFLRQLIKQIGLALSRMQLHIELQQTLNEVQLKNDQLIKLDRVKDEFVANTSHELRTPLHGILGLSELLLQTGLNEEQLEYINMIHSSGMSLFKVINDILDFSRSKNHRVSLKHQNFCLGTLVEEILKVMTVHQRTVEIHVDIDPSVAKQWFVSDVDRLKQVLINLIGNALKFTPKGEITIRVNPKFSSPRRFSRSSSSSSFQSLLPVLGLRERSASAVDNHPYSVLPTITTSASSPSSLSVDRSLENERENEGEEEKLSPMSRSKTQMTVICFEVNDTGIGIPPTHIDQLFQPFTQVDSSVSRLYEGTGLGLTVSQQIVNLLSGGSSSITVKSKLHVGSTFRFELPLRPVPAPSASDVRSPTSQRTRDSPSPPIPSSEEGEIVVDDLVVYSRNRSTQQTVCNLSQSREHSASFVIREVETCSSLLATIDRCETALSSLAKRSSSSSLVVCCIDAGISSFEELMASLGTELDMPPERVMPLLQNKLQTKGCVLVFLTLLVHKIEFRFHLPTKISVISKPLLASSFFKGLLSAIKISGFLHSRSPLSQRQDDPSPSLSSFLSTSLSSSSSSSSSEVIPTSLSSSSSSSYSSPALLSVSPPKKPLFRSASENIDSKSKTAEALIVGPKILLVEDNKVSQMMQVKMLKMLGFSCAVASDGLEAVDLFVSAAINQKDPFDIVFMDCQMPRMDGFAATEAIRKFETEASLPHCHVVAITAGGLGLEKRCMESGMCHTALKPIRLETFRELMNIFSAPSSPSPLLTFRCPFTPLPPS